MTTQNQRWPGLSRRWGVVPWLVFIIAVMTAWAWPIGVGGAMPVGGDVTGFFIGLFSFLGESLRAGRLPVWNDLWGYGFPGLAESQMGVYYPPHLILYRLLKIETAYVVLLVGHTLFGALGVYWWGRRLGISPLGATLAALAWSMSGFFVIHLAHPWGYTTGCWMPWALGLSWTMLREPGSSANLGRACLLSLILVLQVLPGHFQLAFQTQFLIALMAVWMLGEGLLKRNRAEEQSVRDQIASAGMVVLGVALVFPLAAMQLVPTARLARLADGQRGFEYLSGFAATPFHLVSWVAPGLFHRSTAWRPLVWDPFHTSPEENLGYVGLVPLFLAVMAAIKLWRSDRGVRLLLVMAVVTLSLSLGPYAPGFRGLIEIPGFSFFRAPARWSVCTSLALALLAGKGVDGWLTWPRADRVLGRLAWSSLAWVGVMVVVLELAWAAPGRPGLTRVFDRCFQAMPWTGDPSFESIAARARKIEDDPRLPGGVAPSVALKKNIKRKSFAADRGLIYARELGETLGVLIGVLVLGRLAARGRLNPRTGQAVLVGLAVVDLLILSRHRLIDTGPLKPLVEQSPVLARLAREERGTRVADYMGNLAMRSGVGPISAYRTLNLPALEPLTAMARSLAEGPPDNSSAQAAWRATGTAFRVHDPVELRILRLIKREPRSLEEIEDEALAGWLFGQGWVAEQGAWARRFAIERTPGLPIRAWFVPGNATADPGILDHWSGDPREVVALLNEAIPLVGFSPVPGEQAFPVEALEPGWVVVSQLADPQWTGRWLDDDDHVLEPAEIEPAFRQDDGAGGWQRIEVPGSGRATLVLRYEPTDVLTGLSISVVAWSCWVMLILKHGAGRLRRPSTSTTGVPPVEAGRLSWKRQAWRSWGHRDTRPGN